MLNRISIFIFNFNIKGFTETFGALLLSGFGDQSFFVTTVASLSFNKWTVSFASFFALTLIGIVSIVIGSEALNIMPSYIIDMLSISLFLIMGTKMILEGLEMPEDAKLPDSNDKESTLINKYSEDNVVKYNESSRNSNTLLGKNNINNNSYTTTDISNYIDSSFDCNNNLICSNSNILNNNLEVNINTDLNISNDIKNIDISSSSIRKLKGYTKNTSDKKVTKEDVKYMNREKKYINMTSGQLEKEKEFCENSVCKFIDNEELYNSDFVNDEDYLLIKNREKYIKTLHYHKLEFKYAKYNPYLSSFFYEFSQIFMIVFLSNLGETSQISTMYMANQTTLCNVLAAVIISNIILSLMSVWLGKLISDRLSLKNLYIYTGGAFIFFGTVALFASLQIDFKIFNYDAIG